MTAALKDRPDFIPVIEYINIDLLEQNEGQLSVIDEETNRQIGLPRNPRWIRDARYEALKKSIVDDPEYLLYHPLEIYTLSHIKGKDGKYIVVGGNQRLAACKDLGFEQVPCIIFLPNTPMEKLRSYAMKSNLAFGQFDYEILANEWEADELQDFGVEIDYLEAGADTGSGASAGEGEAGEENDPDKYSRKIQPPTYEITGEEPDVDECVDMAAVKRLLAEIEASGVSEEQKEMLRVCAYRHAVIHFDKMAEYYAHQRAEMQNLMENNALVIIDYDKALERGFINLTSRLLGIIENSDEAEERLSDDETVSAEE